MKYLKLQILSLLTFSLVSQVAQADPFDEFFRGVSKGIHHLHRGAERIAHRIVRDSFRKGLPFRAQLERPVQSIISQAAAQDPVRIITGLMAQGHGFSSLTLPLPLSRNRAQPVSIESRPVPRAIEAAPPRLDLFEDSTPEHPELATLKEQFSEEQILSASQVIVRLFNRQENPTREMIVRALRLKTGLSSEATSKLADAISAGVFEGYVEEATKAQSVLVPVMFPYDEISIAAGIVTQGCEEHRTPEQMVAQMCELMNIDQRRAQKIFDAFGSKMFSEYGGEITNAYKRLQEEKDRIQTEAFQNRFSNEQVRQAGDLMVQGHRGHQNQSDIIAHIASQLNLTEENARGLFEGMRDGDIS